MATIRAEITIRRPPYSYGEEGEAVRNARNVIEKAIYKAVADAAAYTGARISEVRVMEGRKEKKET